MTHVPHVPDDGLYLSIFRRGLIPAPIHRRAGVGDPRPRGGMPEILEDTALDHGMATNQLQAITRRSAVVRARQDFMWRCRQVKWPDGANRYSLPMIALFLGGMDHTTILHGVRRHQARLDALSGDNHSSDDCLSPDSPVARGKISA